MTHKEVIQELINEGYIIQYSFSKDRNIVVLLKNKDIYYKKEATTLDELKQCLEDINASIKENKAKSLTQRKHACGDCAHCHLSCDEYYYCDLVDHHSWLDQSTHVNSLGPACDKFLYFRNEVKTIKCTSCGKTAIMKGRELPEGWHPYLEHDNMKCPECREKISEALEHQRQSGKQAYTPKTRSIAHAFFGI